MNRRMCALIALLLLLAPCAWAEEARLYPPVHISLWAEDSLGYEWTCEYDDNGVLSAPMEEILAGEGGSAHDFYFGVNKPGKAEIIFNYGVNWNVTVPERSIICSVTVDEAGGSSVRWVECYSDDHMLMVILPGNLTTGWGWSYQEEAAGMVRLVSEDYQPLDDQLEGAGGNTVYQFKVEQPGTAVLMFNYSNLWEPEAAAAQTYSVIVTANEDMEISLAVDEQ